MTDVPLMNNPMTTAGDTLYGAASGAPTRVPAGTAGQVWTMNAGATAPEWDDPAAAAAAFVGVKAYNSVVQNINAATTTSAVLNSEEYDSGTFHDTASNNSRITIPAGKGGKYLLQGGTFWNSYAGAAHGYLGFRIDGTTNVRGFQTTPNNAAMYMATQAIVALTAGQYVELRISNASSSAADLGHASAVDAQTWFAATFLGA